MFVAEFFVVEDLDEVAGVESECLGGLRALLREFLPLVLDSLDGRVDACALLAESCEVGTVVHEVVPELVVQHRRLGDDALERVVVRLEVERRHVVQSA